MKSRWLGITSLSLLVLITLWLLLLVRSALVHEELTTLAQAQAVSGRMDLAFYMAYANAALFTLLATVLVGGLYLYCRPQAPAASFIGVLFVPVYCTLNLVAYLSQITVVPGLVALAQQPDTQQTASFLLGQMVQEWPGSIIAFINGLAYAVLGIPSLVYGWILTREGGASRLAGILLALSGAASILGMVGVVLGNRLLAIGIIAGGALFWLALFPLTWLLFRQPMGVNASS